MIVQSIDLNLVPGSANPVIHLNQYDKYSNGLKFNLYQDSVFTIPSGSSVTIRGTKPDKNGFDYAATSISDNTVTFNVTEQMTAVAGNVLCELRVVNGQKLIGTQNFVLDIEASPLSNDTIISDSDIPAIVSAADYAAQAEAAANQVGHAKFLEGKDGIANGTDLNNVTETGEYWFNSPTAATLTHCPTTIAGRLIVEKSIGSGNSQYIRQTYIRYNAADGIYTRVSINSGSTWTHWFKLNMTDNGS